VLSDKLFYWLFQSQPDRILSLIDALPADAGGYWFSAPALKEGEYRLDGLLMPNQRGCCNRSPASTPGRWW
jgi:predicted transposase YdaD